MAYVVEVIDHQDAIEHCHTEEGDESYTCRDAEGKAAEP